MITFRNSFLYLKPIQVEKEKNSHNRWLKNQHFSISYLTMVISHQTFRFVGHYFEIKKEN